MKPNNTHDPLQSIFARFEPPLSDDSLFMARLQQNLNDVELIKNQTLAFRHKSKRAMVAAAIAGFMCGVAGTLLYPWLAAILIDLTGSIADKTALDAVQDYGNVALWGVICLITGIVTFTVYDLVGNGKTGLGKSLA